MDFNLYNKNRTVPIDRFGGPFGDNDPTAGAYRLLQASSGFIYYSPAPADQLLTSLDLAFPDFNLKSSKHFDSGVMFSIPTGNILRNTVLDWCLFDGPQGSAWGATASGPDASTRLILNYNGINKKAKRQLNIDINSSPFGVGGETTSMGAAAAIGMGTVVAPWYVPGFEQTHNPSADAGSIDGYAKKLMSIHLVHALASWEQTQYGMYKKSYTIANVNRLIYADAIGIIDESQPGPQLMLPVAESLFQELTTTRNGKQTGPCRLYRFERNGAVMCDLDPYATETQIDAQVRVMFYTLGQWLSGGDSDTAGASPAPMPQVAATATQPSQPFCTGCGAPVHPEANFCGQCGTKLK